MSLSGNVLCSVIAAAALAISVLDAVAQGEFKIMAPAVVGGGFDSTARAMQRVMISAGIARSVEVYNVPGAGGAVGLVQFVRDARRDGSQLMISGHVMVGSVILNKTPVTLNDVTPIARLTSDTQAIAVPANSPIKDANQLAALLRTDPSKVAWAAGSVGGAGYTAVALFGLANNVDPSKLSYNPHGGEKSVEALVSGKVTVGVLSAYGTYEAEIKAGRLRLIAITSAQRRAGIDSPTLVEQGIDMVFENWRSVMAAPTISAEQRKTLAGAVERMAKSPAWAETLKQKGWDDDYLGGEAFEAFMKVEQLRIERAFRATGMLK